jgi:hypothetical protein
VAVAARLPLPHPAAPAAATTATTFPLPAGTIPTLEHPVTGIWDPPPRGASPPEQHFSFAEQGETVRVRNALGVPDGDYPVLFNGRTSIQVELKQTVVPAGGAIVTAGGTEYVVTQGNPGMPGGIGLNERTEFDTTITTALRGKTSGELVTILGRRYLVHDATGLAPDHVRLMAETAVAPRTLEGTHVRLTDGANITALKVENGAFVKSVPQEIPAERVQRLSARPISQAELDAKLYPKGKGSGKGDLKTWVSLPSDTVRFGWKGDVIEVPTSDLRPGVIWTEKAGVSWEIVGVDHEGGTYTRRRAGVPGSPVETQKLYNEAWEVVGYDAAQGQVRLQRTELRVLDTQQVERAITGFPALAAPDAVAGKTVTDNTGTAWTVVAVNDGAHTIELRDAGGAMQTVGFTDTLRNQLNIQAEFGRPIDVSTLTQGGRVVDLVGRSWEVFEVDRGKQPMLTLRRVEHRTEPVENVLRFNRSGARSRVDLEPKTSVMISGNLVTRTFVYLSRSFKGETTGVRIVGVDAVKELPQGRRENRRLKQSHDPAGVPDEKGCKGNLEVMTREYRLEVPDPDKTPRIIKVIVPDAGVTVPAHGADPAVTLTPEQILVRAKEMVANMPLAMVGKVEELIFNPVENAEDNYWRMKNASFSGAAMTAGLNNIDIYPGGLRGLNPGQVNLTLLQLTWHEMGHVWSKRVLAHVDADHVWQDAMKRDGPQNLPSQYAGNAVGEDFAEGVRVFVASNGGRDPIWDIYQGKYVDGSTLRARYGNRFRVLESYFNEYPGEMQALQKEFSEKGAAVLYAFGGAGAGALLAGGGALVSKLLDDKKDKATPAATPALTR